MCEFWLSSPFVCLFNRFQDIGEGTAEVDILEWYVSVGESVEQFTPLCKVQSDKATTDITSPLNGTITELCYAENDIAIVGKPLLHIDVVGEGGDDVASPAKEEAPASAVSLEDHASSVSGSVINTSKPGKVIPAIPASCSISAKKNMRSLQLLPNPLSTTWCTGSDDSRSTTYCEDKRNRSITGLSNVNMTTKLCRVQICSN